MNLEKNRGRGAFNEGADILPPMNFTSSLSTQKRQAVSLTDESMDEYWAGGILVGEPSIPFLVNFDSELLNIPVPWRQVSYQCYSWFGRPLGPIHELYGHPVLKETKIPIFGVTFR